MFSTRLIPEPTLVWQLAGEFTLSPAVNVVGIRLAREVAQQFCDAVNPATGFQLTVQPEPPPDSQPSVIFRLDPTMGILGAEGYELIVKDNQVTIVAAVDIGLFYAVQTLKQLLPAAIYSATPVAGVEWSIPCVYIRDVPRFRWRGAMLDVCRHFMPKEFVLRFIDLLALHKLNTFHWHLTDDQGWRIEIKRYPRLTEVGAWRSETVAGHMHGQTELAFDGVPHGGFYTQDEVREVVTYARSRQVVVIPEIEMPGHAQAAIAAYPELGNTGEPLPVRTYWGVNENVYNVEESTFVFLQNVMDEVLDLFPGMYIHAGGDEVPKTQWRASSRAQARMRELGLANEEELQSYFIRRMEAFLTSRNRRLVGWDEILEGGLAPNATVMSWRGVNGGIAATQAGHDVVMAPNNYTYLDYYQSEDRASEPLGIGGYVPLEMVYSFEPVCEGIAESLAYHVLGAQAQLWTEYIATPQHVEYMAFPRLCALAEVVWTPQGQRNYQSFLSRLKPHLERLDVLGVNYRRLS